jgi:hypothetical protein
MARTRTTRGGLGALLAVMCAALAHVIGAGSSLALALAETTTPPAETPPADATTTAPPAP